MNKTGLTILGIAVEYPLTNEFSFYQNEGGIGEEATNFAHQKDYKVYKSKLIIGEEIIEDCPECGHPENNHSNSCVTVE